MPDDACFAISDEDMEWFRRADISKHLSHRSVDLLISQKRPQSNIMICIRHTPITEVGRI
jgi:hypothetical protein